jgi:hypothetical protein
LAIAGVTPRLAAQHGIEGLGLERTSDHGRRRCGGAGEGGRAAGFTGPAGLATLIWTNIGTKMRALRRDGGLADDGKPDQPGEGPFRWSSPPSGGWRRGGPLVPGGTANRSGRPTLSSPQRLRYARSWEERRWS